ncbi:MAG: hypothetical protein IID46_01070 [Planctomycetes bacterium]|nr:hypothetical protein [Planctomycetota bacterium]
MSMGHYRRNSAKWLKSTIAQSRKDLAMPSLKWFVSQQPPTNDKRVNKINVTSEIGKIAAEDKNFIHIKAFNLPKQEKKLVITTEGVVLLGELIANSFLRHK